MAYGSGESVYGRLSIALSSRSLDALEPIRDIALDHGRLEAVCLDVPPDDYDDETVIEHWSIAPESLPPEEHWQSLTLLVEDSCSSRAGLRLPPAVEAKADAIVIDLRSDPLPWGMACTDDQRPPQSIVIALPESPAGRPATYAVEPCGPHQPAPGATPPPPPRSPTPTLG